MRLQFLPLALCLLMFVLASPSDLTASSSNSNNSTLNIYKSTSKKNKEIANPENSVALNPTEKLLISSHNSTLKDASGTNLPNFHFSQIEENSYNYLEARSANSAKVLNEAGSTTQTNGTIMASSFAEGMFYGFSLMVILLNLVCYFLFNEKLFLIYLLSLVAIGSLLFFNDGLMALIGLESLTMNPTLEAVLVLASCTLGAWFATKYLNLQETFPKLQWVATFLFSASALIIVMNWISGMDLLASIANAVSFSVAGLYFLAGVYLFSKKNYPKFYVIAYSIPLLFAIDYFVLSNLGFEFLSSQPSHLKVALVVEMLLLTYAIVYRMRAIKEEVQMRQTELRIFLKRQEVINRKNAQQLMEEVYLENLIMHYDLDGFEIKLLQYISEGKDNTKIARKLKTTVAEIEEQTKELYQKLEISEHIQEDYRMVDAQADYIYN